MCYFFFFLTASLPKDWETSSDGSWMLHDQLHGNAQSPFKSCWSLNKREPPRPAKPTRNLGLLSEGRDAPPCPLSHWTFYTGANCLRGCWSLTQICSHRLHKRASSPTLVYTRTHRIEKCSHMPNFRIAAEMHRHNFSPPNPKCTVTSPIQPMWGRHSLD